MKKIFLDVFDGTKTSREYYTEEECGNSYVQGESILFYMLMNGRKIMLTQTQIIDSGIIHSILNTPDSKEPFLQFIRERKIEAVLQKGQGACSLVGYMKQSLKHGIEDEKERFVFSIFAFMTLLSKEQQQAVHKKAIEAIEQHHYDFSVEGVDKRYTDLVRKAVINLQDIDRAIEGNYAEAGEFKEHMYEIVQRLPLKQQGTELDPKVAQLWEKIVEQSTADKWDSRSKYYGFLKKVEDKYSSKAIAQVRESVNACYHIAIATTLKDSEVSLNFSEKHKDLIQPIRKTKHAAGQLMALRRLEDAPQIDGQKQDPLTWTRLSAAIKEVDKIQQSKPGISRSEAIKRSKRMQFIKPVTMTARYIGTGLASNALLGAGEGFELLWGAVEEVSGDAVRTPSFKKMLKSYPDSFKQRDLLNKTSQFYTVLVNDSNDSNRESE